MLWDGGRDAIAAKPECGDRATGEATHSSPAPNSASHESSPSERVRRQTRNRNSKLERGTRGVATAPDYGTKHAGKAELYTQYSPIGHTSFCRMVMGKRLGRAAGQ
eukprot:scaffold105777_cov63-Phaeocystis_antarctica.AAC.1